MTTALGLRSNCTTFLQCKMIRTYHPIFDQHTPGLVIGYLLELEPDMRSDLSHAELVAKIAEHLNSMAGVDLATLYNREFDGRVTYIEDGVFTHEQEPDMASDLAPTHPFTEVKFQFNEEFKRWAVVVEGVRDEAQALEAFVAALLTMQIVRPEQQCYAGIETQLKGYAYNIIPAMSVDDAIKAGIMRASGPPGNGGQVDPTQN